MSSANVRTGVLNFLTTNLPTETLIDLDGKYDEIKKLVEDAGISSDAPWLGVEFIGDDEVPITVPAGNNIGRYRETGGIYFHVVGVAAIGIKNTILTRAETVRNLMRGQRIGDILIESVTPANFGEGASLNFEGGYIAASFLVSYEFEINL